jgi:ADP-ribosylglycohydrolase
VPDRAQRSPQKAATIIGAIAGDIVGSVYEHHPIKIKDFPLFYRRCVFTDDTVLTVAVAEAILTGTPHVDAGPCNSWGNGSAMRVSPVGFAFSTEAEVLA